MVQKILITGGNSGIGFELAKKFAAWPSQFHVYFTARSAERGNAALKNIQAEFPSATVGLGWLSGRQKFLVHS